MSVVRPSKMSVNLPNAICSAAQIPNRRCGKKSHVVSELENELQELN
jgi:hypothetical protein